MRGVSGQKPAAPAADRYAVRGRRARGTSPTAGA
jgi:hypothetical protein